MRSRVVVVLMLAILFSSCTGSADGNTDNTAGETSRYHFRGMDISLPKSWKGSGNMCNFYRNNNLPGAYIMVSSFGGAYDCSTDELKEKMEADISKNLELFESTQFYRNKIEFIYEHDSVDEITGDRLVYGILKNGRLNEEMSFYGYYLENPIAYIFGICKRDEDLEAVRSVIDGAIEAASISRDDLDDATE